MRLRSVTVVLGCVLAWLGFTNWPVTALRWLMIVRVVDLDILKPRKYSHSEWGGISRPRYSPCQVLLGRRPAVFAHMLQLPFTEAHVGRHTHGFGI